MNYSLRIKKVIDYLKDKNKILFLTTSNRWNNEKDIPKSSLLARYLANEIGHDKVKIIDVSQLKIYPCEGNVSSSKGNSCGVKHAVLQDDFKNPTGCHRCWASVNNLDDELWQISKEIFDSEAVVIFGSIRWGQMNAVYQKLIERLTWIENRHSTLKEDNIVKTIDAGIIAVGQNWNGKNVISTQKKVLGFYGFKTPSVLSFNWQYTENSNDEKESSYKNARKKFIKDFGIKSF